MADKGKYYKGGSKIRIGDKYVKVKVGAKGYLSDLTLNVLKDALKDSNNPHMTLSSIQRTSAEQASAMYYNTVKNGVQSQYALYGSYGDQVIDEYVTAKAQGKTPSEIKKAMTDKINAIGWNFGHGGNDPSKIQVVDISFKQLRSVSELVSVFQQYEASGKIRKFIYEGDHVHVEILQEDAGGNNIIPSSVSNVSELSENTEPDVNSWVNSGQYNGMTIKQMTDVIAESPIYGSDANKMSLFEYEGMSNNQRIWSMLTFEQKKSSGNGNDSYQESIMYPISNGTVLFFPNQEMYVNPSDSRELTVDGNTREANSTIPEYESNITETNTEDGRYYPKVLKYMSIDPGYVPAYKNRGLVVKEITPRLRVYAWSRALWLSGGTGYIDLTKHIQTMGLSSSMDGSEISLTLTPLIGRLPDGDEGGSWIETDIVDLGGGEIVKLGNINREYRFTDTRFSTQATNFEYIRNNQFHEKVLQQNDMLFVRFEELSTDQDEDLTDKEKLGKGWYDAIGLIDSVDVTSNASNTDVSVNVSARDLTKAFIEDNSYFNPYSVGHSESIYGGSIGSNGRFLNGGFKDISAITDRTIKQSLEFIFHRVSSIGYVPDDIMDMFSGLTNVSVSRKEPNSENDNKTTVIKPARGIWQLVKFWVDDNIKNIRLIDDSVSNPDGSIWDLMNKVCQDPFIEMFTETLGTHFYVIARRPPFEHKILSKIVGDVQKDLGVGGDAAAKQGDYVGGLGVDTTNAYAKYLECLDAKNKNLPRYKYESADQYNAFSGELNSYENRNKQNQLRLMQQIEVTSEEEKKYMEQYGVVFQDDKIINCTEQLRDANDSAYPLIININEDDVFRDSLRHSQTAYAWYQVHDKGNFAGQNVSLGHVPAIYFDEFAQVFGNKKLEVTSNYSDYRFFDSKNKDRNADLYAEQASQLLAFLVETNIHLPFTREGSFTINGDRRIKKGNYIYYRPTREVFYVNSVSNDMTIAGSRIDRTTTVNVSRGMVIDYIDGVEHTLHRRDGSTVVKNVSYFNLVNIDKLKDGIYDVVSGKSATDKFNHKANMAIDVDIMNFFLKKRQKEEKDLK